MNQSPEFDKVVILEKRILELQAQLRRMVEHIAVVQERHEILRNALRHALATDDLISDAIEVRDETPSDD